jgi:hypothetical protein
VVELAAPGPAPAQLDTHTMLTAILGSVKSIHKFSSDVVNQEATLFALIAFVFGHFASSAVSIHVLVNECKLMVNRDQIISYAVGRITSVSL